MVTCKDDISNVYVYLIFSLGLPWLYVDMSGSYSRSMRHPSHDYRKSGYYFVTLVTKDRIPYFGSVKDGRMILNKNGEMAYNCWLDIPKHNSRAQLDAFVIMPEHVHGIILLTGDESQLGQSDPSIWQRKWKSSLSSIIRGYKIGVTKYFRDHQDYEFAWVKSFHDHVISDSHQLQSIRNYIINNPKRYKGEHQDV